MQAGSKDAGVAAAWVYSVVHKTLSDPAPAAGCCHDVVVDEGLIEAVDLMIVLMPGRGLLLDARVAHCLQMADRLVRWVHKQS